MEVAGPLGTPLGLAQRKRASPRGEAGTSGFLPVSDSDRRVPAELGQESQASSCLRKEGGDRAGGRADQLPRVRWDLVAGDGARLRSERAAVGQAPRVRRRVQKP